MTASPVLNPVQRIEQMETTINQEMERNEVRHNMAVNLTATILSDALEKQKKTIDDENSRLNAERAAMSLRNMLRSPNFADKLK